MVVAMAQSFCVDWFFAAVDAAGSPGSQRSWWARPTGLEHAPVVHLAVAPGDLPSLTTDNLALPGHETDPRKPLGQIREGSGASRKAPGSLPTHGALDTAWQTDS